MLQELFKQNTGFSFSRFSPFHACHLRFRGVIGHLRLLRLLTGDNELQEMWSRVETYAWPFCSPKSSEMNDWALLYNIPKYVSISHIVFFNHLTDRKNVCLTGACLRLACMASILLWLSAIGKIFEPAVDLGPRKHFFRELCNKLA